MLGSTVKKLLRDKKKLISKHLPMMPIGKKITVKENEEKIGVVSESLMNDKAAEKIGVWCLKKDSLERRKIERH